MLQSEDDEFKKMLADVRVAARDQRGKIELWLMTTMITLHGGILLVIANHLFSSDKPAAISEGLRVAAIAPTMGILFAFCAGMMAHTRTILDEMKAEELVNPTSYRRLINVIPLVFLSCSCMLFLATLFFVTHARIS